MKGQRNAGFSSRPPIERMQWLDEQLRNGRYPNVAKAVEHFEISRRTFLRDVMYLRLMLDAPIAYDRSQRGYYYTNPTFRLSAVQLREGELFALLVADKVLRPPGRHHRRPHRGRLLAFLRRGADPRPQPRDLPDLCRSHPPPRRGPDAIPHPEP